MSRISYRRLIPLCLLLGVAVGLFCAGFYMAWHHLHVFVWARFPHLWQRVAVSASGGLVIGILLHRMWDPGTMSDIVRHFHAQGALSAADNKPMLPISLIGLVAGSSAGPEGVLTQVGGSAGTWLARRAGRPELTRVLTLAGMGAGFGAFLGAPIGGAILWLELPHRRGLEYYEALVPTLTASLAGYVVLASLLDLNLLPTWPITFATMHAAYLWQAAVVGVIAGAAALVYSYLFAAVGAGFARFRVPIWAKTTLGGAMLGAIGAVVPLAYFYGRGEIGPLLSLDAGFVPLLAILAAKMLASSITIRSHWQGGLIVPHLFMGAAAGKLVALAVPAVPAPMAMACGMAAFNAAATHTPLASPLIVLALTGFSASAPVFLASITGFFIGQRLDLIANKAERGYLETPTPRSVERAA